MPSEDQPGNTMLLGIADRAIALTSALLVAVTETLMPEEVLPERPTVGQRVGLISVVGRGRRTTCTSPGRPLVSKQDVRVLERFAALRNALAHQEGQRIDVADLGHYDARRVSEILDVCETIATMTVVDETICVEALTIIQGSGADD